jgi:hypothetical protein
MTQALYAHMNNKRKKKKDVSIQNRYLLAMKLHLEHITDYKDS